MTDALISVMIVDDEPLYIEEINRIYPMAEHGFELVCTAINGKDALTKFRKYHPQIVITDIEMPILNGIELCKAIRRESQDTKLLFLTVYNELDYIRSALRLSAFDYILKFELSPETLDEKMNAMRRQILSERETELELLQNSVYSLFSDPDTSSAHALLLEKRLPGLYLYLVAEINRPLPFLSPAPAPADADRFRLMVLSAGIGDYVFSLDRAHLLVFLNPGRSAGEHAFHALVSHRATQLKELLSSCGEQFTFYTCSSPMDILTFARYYRKNLRTFEHKYFQKGNVFPLSPLPSVPEPDKVDVSPLIRAVGKADSHAAEAAAGTIADQLRTAGSLELLLNTVRDLYYTLKSVCADMVCQVPAPDQCYTLADIERWLKSTVLAIVREKSELPTGPLSAPIRQAVAYINQNLSNKNLTIDMVAKQVFLSTGHLNKLFRQEMRITIYQYLKTARINRAKQLLSSTPLPVYEIAEQCGYGSSQYFSVFFHEAVGMSPNAYRRNS